MDPGKRWLQEEFERLPDDQTPKRKRKQKDIGEKPKRGTTMPRTGKGTFRHEVRALLLAVITALIALGIAISNYWLYHTGDAPKTAGADAIATAIPTIESVVPTSLLEGHAFLSQEDARNLRTKANVVNLAVLRGNGSVAYSATSSIRFVKEAPFHPIAVRPYGLESLSVNGTAVLLLFNRHSYGINIYQPFLLETQLKSTATLYVVDETGQLWEAVYEADLLIPVGSAESIIPHTIDPNPNLSFTY